MFGMENTSAMTGKTIIRLATLLIAAGVVFWGVEHWGDGALSRLSGYVASMGWAGILIFIAANALAVMLFIPQVPFTVMAGALFGWKLGTVWASLAMTLGAVGAFLLARYGVRERLEARFKENKVFVKLQQVSRKHPLHVVSVTRLVPIIPFPVASYMLGVTKVRLLPYSVLTFVCMVPETLFLSSGGHLLHSGITGKRSLEAAVVVGVAGVVLGLVVHQMKKKFEAVPDN